MKNVLFKNPVILRILEKYESIWALDHLGKLASWDSEVYMPVKGAKYRGHALAKVQTLTKEIITSSDFQSLLNSTENEELNIERKNISLIKKYYDWNV